MGNRFVSYRGEEEEEEEEEEVVVVEEEEEEEEEEDEIKEKNQVSGPSWSWSVNRSGRRRLESFNPEQPPDDPAVRRSATRARFGVFVLVSDSSRYKKQRSLTILQLSSYLAWLTG